MMGKIFYSIQRYIDGMICSATSKPHVI